MPFCNVIRNMNEINSNILTWKAVFPLGFFGSIRGTGGLVRLKMFYIENVPSATPQTSR